MTLLFRSLAVLLVATSALAAERVDPLVRARTLYNEGRYELAIAAAEEGGRLPQRADSAALVVARAYLEQYRSTRMPGELEEAHSRLRQINPARLTPAERLELLVGMGEALYFDGAPGAASDLFDSVLAEPALEPKAHEHVLDWWATALDEEMRSRSATDRVAGYGRIRDRMRVELGRHQDSAAASYWLAAAARRQGDLPGSWSAARAGWVRAALAGDRSAALRGDIDRLVVESIVPARSRQLSVPADDLIRDWEEFKARWRADSEAGSPPA